MRKDGNNYRSLIAAVYALTNPRCSLVPLSPAQGKADIEHILNDSNASLIDLDRDISIAPSKPTTTLETDSGPSLVRPVGENPDEEKLVIYTSGTTGKPKGVVHSARSLTAQIDMLISAWRWSRNDTILHSLPLNHIHGLVNAFLCPLAVGASVEFQSPFDPRLTWARWYYGGQGGHSNAETISKWLTPVPACKPITIYMAVPTMYAKLYECFRAFPVHTQQQLSQSLVHSDMRLQISGSAPLPTALFDSWHRKVWMSDPRGALLERYGMTEIGMALGNPLEGPRVAGTVGRPFAGVECRLNESDSSSSDGELLVRSPALFSGYLNNQMATRESFTEDGFFRTGDIARVEPVQESGNGDSQIFFYKLLGRSSVDIIKTGGYKVSALEIEQALLNHPDVREACVLGLPDQTYGQMIYAIIVPRSTAGESLLNATDLQDWLRRQYQLSPYKIPRKFSIQKEIPRNQLGKINKKSLIANLSVKE